MANTSNIENDVVNLELAATLVDEDHIDEFEAVLHNSLEEIRGNKELVCSECGKKYKTEGGRRRHILNKHTSQVLLSKDDLKRIIEEVVNKVISDGWYGEEIAQQLKVLPSICCDNDVFVNLMQKCYRNMEINKEQDKLMFFFSSKIFPDIPALFPDNDSRIINIIMVNLPAKLTSHIKKHDATTAVNVSCVQRLTDQEKGPLRYIIGAVISKLYRKSKRTKESESTADIMLQNLLLSMRIPTELNEYLLNADRGAYGTLVIFLLSLLRLWKSFSGKRPIIR